MAITTKIKVSAALLTIIERKGKRQWRVGYTRKFTDPLVLCDFPSLRKAKEFVASLKCASSSPVQG